jgi:hypothetical protein
VTAARPARRRAWRALATGVLAAVVTGTATPAPAQPPANDTSARIAAQAQRATERLARLQRDAAALARTQQSLLTTLRELDLARSIAEAQAQQADAAARAAAADLARADATVAMLDARVAALQPAVRATVRRSTSAGAPTAPRGRWLRPVGDRTAGCRGPGRRDRAVIAN